MIWLLRFGRGKADKARYDGELRRGQSRRGGADKVMCGVVRQGVAWLITQQTMAAKHRP